MSEVILNRIGVDHVNFNITTSGDSVATCTLDKVMLDPTLEYLLRVSELNCPMSGLPLFGFNADGTTTVNQELFRIKRRVANTNEAAFLAPGSQFETDVYLGYNGGGQPFSSVVRTQGPGDVVYFSATNFISDLGKSANNFSRNQDLIGAVPDGDPNVDPAALPNGSSGIPGSDSDYMWIRLNADGIVEFIGTSLFWNNFVIQFTPYGKHLLGVNSDFLDDHNCMCVSSRANGTLVYEFFDAGNTVIDLQNDNAYIPLVETVRLTGSYPIFRNLDHRYFVSVETDLLVSSTIKVVDGKQTIDRSICKAFFPTDCKVLLESEDGVLREDVDFEVEALLGQHGFVKKTEPSRQWTALQTSYDLRFYRFHLYITYRYYNVRTNLWEFARMKYPIQADDSWSIGLEFVSKI